MEWSADLRAGTTGPVWTAGDVKQLRAIYPLRTIARMHTLTDHLLQRLGPD